MSWNCLTTLLPLLLQRSRGKNMVEKIVLPMMMKVVVVKVVVVMVVVMMMMKKD